jgi:hypothetical protein
MAEKYLDYSGVQTLWNAVKTRDEQFAAKKAGYIAYDSVNKTIQLWASETDYETSKTNSEIVPISTVDATPFIKDGILEEVKIVPAKEVGPIEYKGETYTDDTLFIQFKWNAESGKTSDYILLTDIAPVYTEGEGINIENNKISFDSGKATQITTTDKITLGGTWLGDQLKAKGIKEIPGGTNLQKFFKDLLSVESWPGNPRRIIPGNLTVTNGGPTVGFYKNSNYTSLEDANVEVGTTVYLMIKGNNATASATISYDGFTNGYSPVPDTDSTFSTVKKTSGNPSSVTVTGDEVSDGKYSISVTQNNTGLEIPAFTSNADATQVKLSSAIPYTVKDGTVTVKASQTCPNFTGSCAAGDLKKYYALSTLEATSEKHVVDAGSTVTLTGNGTTASGSDSITGFRRLFWGSDASNDPSVFTSSYIRSHAGGSATSGAAATGNYFPTATGKKMVWVAFPSTNKWKVTAAYLPPYTSNDFASKFVSKTVSVDGANNTEPTDYTVLYAAYDLAFSEKDVRITLG